MPEKPGIQVFADQGASVYDNMFSKPPQIGDEANARYSVDVLFSVESPSSGDVKENPGLEKIRAGTWHGQYNFEACTWRILPSDIDQPTAGVPDRFVSCWWHLPTYRAICADYAAGAMTGNRVPPLRSKTFSIDDSL